MDYRSEFPQFTSGVYLDMAHQGPFPRTTVARLQQAIELKCHPERLEAPEYFDLPNRVRARIARLVGADTSEIALTNSATQGIGAIATGLGLKPGDEVVIANSNFPSNLFTWLHLRRLGICAKVLKPAGGEVAPESLDAALSARTRVVALDWVNYSTGYRIDLSAFGERAHNAGAIFVVDGTQGAGALELNLHALPVDALAVATYKWFLGPYGTGFVFLSHALQGRLDVPVVNWSAVEGAENFDALPTDQFTLAKGARVFDVPETANFLNMSALEASLEFLERATVHAVTEHCRLLLDLLAEELRRKGYTLSGAAHPEHASTILGFQAPSLEATQRVYEKLRAHQIAVSLRHGMIRVSPYLFNSEVDIHRLVAVVG
ncbi:MAG: aminotransferase class V-fold PLP-dependent enzyme [Acidobacteriia bacterium]|nr:aminotransferase class V-fold PLP-dependent enzyme [Terriglobia bacterium]